MHNILAFPICIDIVQIFCRNIMSCTVIKKISLSAYAQLRNLLMDRKWLLSSIKFIHAILRKFLLSKFVCTRGHWRKKLINRTNLLHDFTIYAMHWFLSNHCKKNLKIFLEILCFHFPSICNLYIPRVFSFKLNIAYYVANKTPCM